MKDKIISSLEKVRKYLQADGGDVEFVSEENGIVKVRLTGACGGCPMATMTLKNVVEEMIKADIPEVKSVIPV
jgi:Fe-S cluster biogenesis protein NfuA